MTRTMVVPSAGASALRPLDGGMRVTDGFWAERLATNREVTIPHGLAQLEASGALGNFRHAARGSGRYVGGLDDAGLTFPFLDSDVYKWLEAVGWELGREGDAGLAQEAGAVIDLVAEAQRPDGYLNTFVQLSGRERYSDLQWGHELYCIGHLAQAAVAWQRALGDDRLLQVVSRAIDHVDGALGPDRREAIDGHPEIEMALVELYRLTGRERFLELARSQVERRGRGLLGVGRLGARYWQDHLPVREAQTMTGHAVRQLYLDCGVVDLAVETADQELLAAVLRRWTDMWATRTYLTGALGSHHRDEAFGDAWELPPDRAYAETCAGIASVMLSWRLLLATGESRFADAIERTLYNAVLPGLSRDGTHFFYTNPLQMRPRVGAGGASAVEAAGGRKAWYPCACCPPNIMRTLSSFEQLVATWDDGGIQLHQFAAGAVATPLGDGAARLRVETDQPWDGPVSVIVEEAPRHPWAISVRVPAWLRTGRLTVASETRPIEPGIGELRIERVWAAGDRLELDLDMPARYTVPNDHVDAVRGSAAVERGPLVYCLEQADLPAGVAVDDVELDMGRAPDGGRAIGIRARVRADTGPSAEWPYRDADGGPSAQDAAPPRTADAETPLALTIGPYYSWANRDPGPMRVWIPRAPD